MIDSLAPGSYTLLVKLNGYQDWQASQQVTAGQTAQVSATLLPSASATPTPTQTGLLPLIILTGIGLLFLAIRRH